MGSNNINSNLNLFFTKVLQQGIADKNKDGVVSNDEKAENDALLGFSRDVEDLFSLTSEGNWEEALELAENIDIAEKQKTAVRLSKELDNNKDNQIDMSEIENHDLYGGLTNIFTDATTTFKMEDFENFAQMLDIDRDTEVTNNEKTVFNSLTSAVKVGNYDGIELTDENKSNLSEALQQTVLGKELEKKLIDAMNAFNGAALVKLETEQGIKDYESVEISSDITYNIAGWSNFDEDTKDKIIKMLEVKDTGLWSAHDGSWLNVEVSEDGDSITLTNKTNLNIQFEPNFWITQSMSANFDNEGIYESYVDAYQTGTNNTKRTQYCFNGDISENIKTQDGELVSSSLTRFLPNGKSWKYTNYMNGTFGEERIHVEYDADGNVLQEQRHFNLPSNAVFADIETGLVFENLDNQEAQSIMIIKFPDGTVEVTGNSLKINVDTVMSAQDNSSNSREGYKLIVNGDNNDIQGTFKDDQITVRGNNNTVRGADGNDNIKVYGDNNTIDPLFIRGGSEIPYHGAEGDDIITVEGNNNEVNATLGNDNITVIGSDNVIDGDLGDFVKTYNSQNQLENIIVNGVTIDASGINTICQYAFNDVQNIPSLENINFVLELLSKISLDDEIDETDVEAFNYTIALIANDSEISEDEKQVIFDALANYIYGIDLDAEQKDIVGTFIYTAKGLRQSWPVEPPKVGTVEFLDNILGSDYNLKDYKPEYDDQGRIVKLVKILPEGMVSTVSVNINIKYDDEKQEIGIHVDMMMVGNAYVENFYNYDGKLVREYMSNLHTLGPGGWEEITEYNDDGSKVVTKITADGGKTITKTDTQKDVMLYTVQDLCVEKYPALEEDEIYFETPPSSNELPNKQAVMLLEVGSTVTIFKDGFVSVKNTNDKLLYDQYGDLYTGWYEGVEYDMGLELG